VTTSPHRSALPHPDRAGRPLALVAGGSRGLGLLIARELGRRGYRLAVCARNADELAEAARILAEDGHEVRVDVCDVADAAAVQDLVDRLERESGPVEVAVAVAGVIQVGPLSSMTRAHFEEAVGIMLWGPVNLALALLPAMRSRARGRIGVVSSIGGVVAVPHLLPYSTAKFGALGFSSGLRAELAGTGITVTSIVPGLMRTGSHLRAEFVGNQAREFGWFSLGATLPLVSMDAERAAARIVSGVLAGRAYVLLTWMTKAAVRVSGLAPTVTATLVGVGSRLLPSGAGASTDTDTVQGYQARERMTGTARRVLDGVTTLGRRASRRFNQAQR
jgi:short-subunit dehydrogenase